MGNIEPIEQVNQKVMLETVEDIKREIANEKRKEQELLAEQEFTALKLMNSMENIATLQIMLNAKLKELEEGEED